jgi:DNA polymerase-3 subunit delta'
VVVVDDADDLNEESASCFLKTLEEPPVGSVLILIGSSPDRQLATIVSRCQVIRFAPLPTDLVEDLLAKNGIQDAWRSRLADLSGGSPGVALGLADPELWSFRRRLIDGLAERPIDAIGLGRAWAEFVEAAGKESAPQRGRARLALRLLVEFLDDALVVGQGGQPRRTTSDDAAALEKIAARLNPDLIIDLLERCLQADGHIERRVQLSLALESLLDALGQKLAAV